jgi:hypothetical protein
MLTTIALGIGMRSCTYKQGGKLYMMEDSANEKASQSFQSNFDIDY